MTIEHKTTHGPHGAGQLAADWMLESGIPGETVGPRATVRDLVRLAVPHQDMALTLESAASLRDALTDHLENMDSPTEALSNEPARTAGTIKVDQFTISPGFMSEEELRKRADKVFQGQPNPWTAPPSPADVVEVAEHIRDAYADNSRTIDAKDVGGMTDQEAAEALAECQPVPNGWGWQDKAGILYTSAAVRELEVKAARHRSTLEPRVPTDAQLERLATDVLAHMEEDALESPVTPTPGPVNRNTVQAWTDEQARGAWNHLMVAGDANSLLDEDRPTGRHYTALASHKLRERLNEINGADADRG